MSCASRTRAQRGFTLLEIMVALSIFSVCAMVLIQQSGRSARQSQYLQNRTLVTWLAENELHRLRSQLEWPDIGKKNTLIPLAHRQWEVNTEVEKTQHPLMRRVEVRVSEHIPGEKTQSFSMIGYLGKH